MRNLNLEELGIDENEAARWQAIASIPESVFEEYIETCEQLQLEISAEGLLRFAKQTERSRRPHGYGRPATTAAVFAGQHQRVRVEWNLPTLVANRFGNWWLS
jgi:hypothetical protein